MYLFITERPKKNERFAALLVAWSTVMAFHHELYSGKQPASRAIGDDVLTPSTGCLMVAIPAYNEELTIGSVVARARRHADRVIVIDDGSDDGTADVAELVGAEVFRHPVNEGYGSAIRDCLQIARDCDVEVLVTLDGDGQHNPDDIPQLIDEMRRSGADIVIGSRFVHGAKNRTIPRYRKFGMKMLNHATTLSSGLRLSDSQSGFRAYSRKALHAIDVNQNGMGVSSEIIIRAADSNLKVKESGIVTRYDGIRESSKGPVRHGLDVINSIIRVVSQKHPILFFGVPGLFFLAGGVLLFLRALDVFNRTNNLITIYMLGWLFCIAVGLFGVLAALLLWSVQDINARVRR
jgi:glycosyltransferase involved in cell wall biosynthesis